MNPIVLTKNWNNPSDFPTIETSEAQVRADIQILYTELATGLNSVINALSSEGGASEITAAAIQGFTGTTVQAILEAVAAKVLTNETDINSAVVNATLNESTGVITFTRDDGSTFTIDTLLEKVIVNFDFDQSTQELVITLKDGTQKRVSLSAFIKETEFLDSSSIVFTVNNHQVTASIKTDYLTAMNQAKEAAAASASVASSKADAASSSATSAAASAGDASDSAVESRSYARGGTGTRTGESTDNSKYYKEQAQAYATTASTKASEASASASSASTSASTATTQATLSKSYAVGGTGSRQGEATDNAEYYKDQAKENADKVVNLTVTAETLEPGSTATVTKTLESDHYNLNFGIPQGDVGDEGPQGDPGEAATITVGTVTTGAPGTPATVTNVGTEKDAVFNFTIPQGAKGDAGEGSGDMLAADYDANSAVRLAGGIAAYVEANGGKIDHIKLNGTEQTITNKTVNLTVVTQNDIDTAVASEATLRSNADTALQTQIDAITSQSDVVDVVGTKAELTAYDEPVYKGDIVKVLADESQSGAISYYRVGGTVEPPEQPEPPYTWVFIGSQGPYYTKSETYSQSQVDTAISTAVSNHNSSGSAHSDIRTALDGKQPTLPAGSNDTYLHRNASTGALEFVTLQTSAKAKVYILILSKDKWVADVDRYYQQVTIAGMTANHIAVAETTGLLALNMQDDIEANLAVWGNGITAGTFAGYVRIYSSQAPTVDNSVRLTVWDTDGEVTIDNR